MVSLATHYGEGPVAVDTVVREQGVTANYIHVLMGGMKTAGLVRSVRGPNGGYELTRSPAEITAFDVVSALEGDLVPAECVAEPGSCPRAASCPTREVWCQVARSVDDVLKSMTLRTLAEQQHDQQSIPSFCI